MYIHLYVSAYAYVYVDIYISLGDQWPEHWGKSRAQSRCQGTKMGSVLVVDRIIVYVVQRSLWNDALQRKDSDEAIESFWRCKFVEIWLFLWSAGGPRGVPMGPRGVPGRSQGPGGPLRGLFRSQGSVSWAELHFFSSQNVQKRNKL